MLVLLYISMLVFGSYLAYIIGTFGVPYSISDSYYLLEREHPHKGLKYLFTGFCWGAGFPLLPVWFETTPDEYTAIVFFAIAALLFIGAAPRFKEKMEGMVHYVSAGVCVIMSQLWCLFVAHTWYISLPAFLIFCSIPLFSKKKKWVFWIEIAAFLSSYAALFVKLFANENLL